MAIGLSRTIYTGRSTSLQFDEINNFARPPATAGDRVAYRSKRCDDRQERLGHMKREKARMKTLFLGHFAASFAPRILSKLKTPLETRILKNEGDAERLAPLLADAQIVVGHIWRTSFPPAPRLRLLQSVAAGLDLLDTDALPKGVSVCNVFGHEPAIAEYVIMTMLVLTHRMFEAVTAFRAGSWVASPQFGGGPPHGEVLGRTIGIV